MKKRTVERIESILLKCIDGALTRTSKNQSHRPFHEALLTRSLVNASAFERSFSTSFGQGPIEQISMIVAEENGFKCERQKESQINIFKGAEDEISRIMTALRDGEKKPDWEKEVNKIAAFSKGDTVVKRIISDLWLMKDGMEYFISIKTVKPNLDQTEKAKKDLLSLKAHNANYQTFFGIYYNPGGENREEYNWSIPSKIFEMKTDPCVLIGKDYWNFLGGSKTYSELLELFQKIGLETREKIRSISSRK